MTQLCYAWRNKPHLFFDEGGESILWIVYGRPFHPLLFLRRSWEICVRFAVQQSIFFHLPQCGLSVNPITYCYKHCFSSSTSHRLLISSHLYLNARWCVLCEEKNSFSWKFLKLLPHTCYPYSKAQLVRASKLGLGKRLHTCISPTRDLWKSYDIHAILYCIRCPVDY